MRCRFPGGALLCVVVLVVWGRAVLLVGWHGLFLVVVDVVVGCSLLLCVVRGWSVVVRGCRVLVCVVIRCMGLYDGFRSGVVVVVCRWWALVFGCMDCVV